MSGYRLANLERTQADCWLKAPNVTKRRNEHALPRVMGEEDGETEGIKDAYVNDESRPVTGDGPDA